MREEYNYKKLGDICDKINGLWKGEKAPFRKVGVIRNANFTKQFTLDYSNVEYLDVEEKLYTKRKLIQGDLIIEKSGGSEKQPVGRAVLFDKADGEYSFSNFTSVLRIKDKEEYLPRFLYLFLLFVYLQGDTKSMQSATVGLHNLDFDKYLNIDVPILHLSEQQHIVSYLDSAFANIDAISKNAEDSLNQANVLFQKALTKTLEKKEGWESKKLSDVCDLVTDFVAAGSFSSLRENVKYKKDKDFAQLVRTTDLKSNFTKGNFVYVDEHAFNFLYRVNLNKECVILPNVGVNCGEVYYVNPADLPYNNSVLGPNAVLVRSSTCNNKFLTYLFKGREFQRELHNIISQMAQPKFNKTSLKTLFLSIPSIKEQQHIVTDLDEISQYINTLSQNYSRTLSECAALKQSILRETFE